MKHTHHREVLAAWLRVLLVGVFLCLVLAVGAKEPDSGSREELYMRSSGESWTFPGATENWSGEDLYNNTCPACHGTVGEGLVPRQAPKIAGLQPWYLERQLTNFKTGIRGGHAEDLNGSQMVLFAWALGDDEEIRWLAAYIAALPDTMAPQTIKGDVGRGKEIYKICAVCHGQQGEGNKEFGAPRLAGMDDWYLASQLKNFRAGVRGYCDKDSFGQQMAVAINGLLTDDAAVMDVVDYINLLSKKRLKREVSVPDK
jgi:cytochrome c oxidase subunit 2